MKKSPLLIQAGPTARRILERDGFSHDHFKVMFGASGGAKWLMLNRMDRVLFGGDFFRGRTDPLLMFGSSIGCWRFASAAQDDVNAAIDRLEKAYIDYHWPADTDAKLITEVSYQMIDDCLGGAGIDAALAHPFMRLCFAAERVRKGLAFAPAPVMTIAMLLTFGLNALSRQSLNWLFERVMVQDPRHGFDANNIDRFSTKTIPLTNGNFAKAMMASSSIPIVMEPVFDIPEGEKGLYLDGGLIDYHWDFNALKYEGVDSDALALHMHFTPRIVPGWFDKALKWRKPSAQATDRMVMISPSWDFIETLPDSQISTRKDFKRFDNEARIRHWYDILAQTDALAEELARIIETGDIASHLTSFDAQ